MHSKGKKTPWCFGNKDIVCFKVCFNFITVLPLTIGNDRLQIVFLARRIHPPFDNDSSTIRSLVHILVQVLNGRYGRTYLLVDVHMVLGCQVKIAWDNPLVIHHALRLWIYKNAGLMALVLGVPVNITLQFFIKRTRVPFLALSLLDTLSTPWGTQMWVPNRKQRKNKESRHAPWLASLWKGKGACWSSKMGLGRVDKLYLLTQTCTKPTQGD